MMQTNTHEEATLALADAIDAYYANGGTVNMFLSSLRNQISKGRTMTVRQLEAGRRTLAAFSAGGAIETGVRYERIAEFFRSATEKSSRRSHRVSLPNPDGGRIHFKIAGERSRHPNSILLSDGGPYPDGAFYGRISLTDGAFFPPQPISDGIQKVLSDFDRSPGEYASEVGRRTGLCVFCGRELTDEASIRSGYGPVCAEKYGLPML